MASMFQRLLLQPCQRGRRGGRGRAADLEPGLCAASRRLFFPAGGIHAAGGSLGLRTDPALSGGEAETAASGTAADGTAPDAGLCAGTAGILHGRRDVLKGMRKNKKVASLAEI